MRRGLGALVLGLLLGGLAAPPYGGGTAAHAAMPPREEQTRQGQPACTPHEVLRTWPLRRLAWQTVVVPAQETNVGAVGDLVAAGAGGVILFGSHAPADVGERLRRLSARAPQGIAPFVMTDEEGGAVQRMADLVGSMPSARRMGATMTARQIRALARRVGGRMAAAGVTMDLAPVLDLDAGPGPDADDPIGTRSFSARPRVAARDGLAFAGGLRAAGVVPVVKHFPGLGGATSNTDVHAASTRPWSRLRKRDLKPFEAAVRAGMPAVMTSNARVPGLSSVPASLSAAVTTGVLRRRLGFDGLVVTDSLSAVAIRRAGYSVPAAAARALQVGADLVLFDAVPRQVGPVARATVSKVVAAVRSGTLPRRRLEAAVQHGLEARGLDLCGPGGRVSPAAASAAGPASPRPARARHAGSRPGRRTPR